MLCPDGDKFDCQKPSTWKIKYPSKEEKDKMRKKKANKKKVEL